MAIKKVRVILDTNWYISATINKNSRRILYGLLANNNLAIIYSTEILKEYYEVISRNKFKNIIKFQQAARFIDLVISQTEKIKIETDLKGSRDANDNFLLSLAFDGKADYLITGDKDLLVLEKTGSTQILTLNNFLEIIFHKAQQAGHPDRRKK